MRRQQQTGDIDEAVRRSFKASAPATDVDGAWVRVCRDAGTEPAAARPAVSRQVTRGGTRRRKLILAAVTAVAVCAVGIGTYAVLDHYYLHRQPVIYIGDSTGTTGFMSPGSWTSFTVVAGPAEAPEFAAMWSRVAETAGFVAESTYLAGLSMEFSAEGVVLSLDAKAVTGDGRLVTLQFVPHEDSKESPAVDTRLRVAVSLAPVTGPAPDAASPALPSEVFKAIDTVGLASLAEPTASANPGTDSGSYSLGLSRASELAVDGATIGNPIYGWVDGAWQALAPGSSLGDPSSDAVVLVTSTTGPSTTGQLRFHGPIILGVYFVIPRRVATSADLGSDIRVWSGGSWTELHPAGTPPAARSGHSMVLDTTTGNVILFGGAGANGLLDDTWSYDPAGTSWTALHPTGQLPAARSGHSLVFAPTTGNVILFGGNGANGLLGDIWSYDTVADRWTELHPAGPAPSPRQGQSMVFYNEEIAPETGTIEAGKIILFGGQGADGVLGDTWSYDPFANTWTELHPAGPVPSPRQGQSLVVCTMMDQARDSSGTGQIYLFGKELLPSVDAMGAHLDRIVLFGGAGDAGVRQDIWIYDPFNNAWSESAGGPGASLPAGRYGQATACDDFAGTIALFGGVGSDSEVLGDSYACFLRRDRWWTSSYGSGYQPSPRSGSSMVWCNVDDMVVLFGGVDKDGVLLNDTWDFAAGSLVYAK